MKPTKIGDPIPSVIELNKDVEPFVIQGTAIRSMFFKDEFKPLQFIHFSDVHAISELWGRISEYINYYNNYISFGLHTGDYCGGSQEQYVDCYNECTPCHNPILNCVGNHDTVSLIDGKLIKTDKETVHKLLFNRTDDWKVNFMPIEHSMAYYKDFPDSKIRLIVIDQYYDIEEQRQWVKERLDEALNENLHVITASHTQTEYIEKKLDVTFCSITDFESIENYRQKIFLEELLVDFKKAGGIHVVHLSGHRHHDVLGCTQNGIFNIAIECATSWNGYTDAKRIRGSKTFDCFNVVSVDPITHVLKLIRVGNNADCYLRVKHTLCYDYVDNKIVFG